LAVRLQFRRGMLRLVLRVTAWVIAAGCVLLVAAARRPDLEVVVARPVTVPVPLAVVLPAPAPPPSPPPAVLPLVVGSGVRGCALPAEVGVPVDGLASLAGVRPPARRLVMVAAASEACVIARSDGITVELSVDDGRSFMTVLEAPGPVGALVALSDGTVLAARGDELLGAVLPDGTATWRRLPARGGILRSSGRWLGLAVNGLLALSDDRGATWRWRHLPVGAADESLRIHVANGAVRVAAGGALFVEAGDGWRPLWTATEAVVSWAFGDRGWLYAFLGDDDERVQLVAVSPGGRARSLTPRTTPDVTIWPHEVASNGSAAVANVADTVTRLHRGCIVETACAGEACLPDLEQSPWPVNRLRAVDRRGLPLVEQRNHDGHLVRLTPAGPRALL
jgi:hypothetical protein